MAYRLLTEAGDGIGKEDGSGSVALDPSFSLVASANAAPGTCTVDATTPAIDTTGATALFVIIGNSNTGPNPPTFTDSKGNTYANAGTVAGAENRITAFYCAPTSVGAGHTILLPGTNVCATVHFIALSVTPVLSIVEQIVLTAVNGTTVISPGSVYPTRNAAFLLTGVAHVVVGGTAAVDNGFTQIEQNTCVSGGHYGMLTAYRQLPTPSNVTPTFTMSGSSHCTSFLLSIYDAADNAPAVTQAGAEVFGSDLAFATSTQVGAEVFAQTFPFAVVTQAGAEVFTIAGVGGGGSGTTFPALTVAL